MKTDPAARPVRVLIVDDTPDLRALLRIALERGGFAVAAEAGDGRQGIDAAREHQPDLILLDLAMPVMDGLEALPMLRQICPAAKIVVLSGFGAAQMTRRALAAGADGYLQKGVPIKTILGYVRDLTDESAPLPPRSLAVVPEPPEEAPRLRSRPAAQSPAQDLPEVVRLAPFGVVEVLDEPIFRVVVANDAAEQLLGRPVRAGTPLFAVTPELAGRIAQHRGPEPSVFEVSLAGGAASVALRRAEGSRFLFLVPGGGAAALLPLLGSGTAEREGLLTQVARHARGLDEPSGTTDAAAALARRDADRDDVVVDVRDARPVTVADDQFDGLVDHLLHEAAGRAGPPYTLRLRTADDPAYVVLDVVDGAGGTSSVTLPTQG